MAQRRITGSKVGTRGSYLGLWIEEAWERDNRTTRGCMNGYYQVQYREFFLKLNGIG